jgi:hypothetical protein
MLVLFIYTSDSCRHLDERATLRFELFADLR